MCGIIGVYNYRESGSKLGEAEVIRARDVMRSRGPDDEGYWTNSSCSVQLAHRRLSVLDLSDRGHQPMWSGSAHSVIVFNGEIYNFQELRKELEAVGSTFQTGTDTEVLLEVYEQWGSKGFTRLRGMFAFGIWDTTRQELLLYRDPLGIKPLYYSDQGGCFFFASQLRALLCFPQITREVSLQAIASYLMLGSIAEPNTILDGTYMLEPGELAIVSKKNGVVRQHLRSYFSAENPSVNPADALGNSVRAHLISDAPCGFFLSAGLDSSLLLASAARSTEQEFRTVTLGFEQLRGTSNDETELAAQTAKLFNTDHHTIWIGAAETRDLLDRLFQAMDQPSIDGMNTYLVSKAAREAGLTVALSGVGGDELFSGYPSFTNIPKILAVGRFLRGCPKLRRQSRTLLASVLPSGISPKYAGLLEYSSDLNDAYLLRRGLFMPWEIAANTEYLEQALSDARRELATWDNWPKGSSLNRKIAALEFSWYMRNQLLRDTDWASMAHSLEVRTPFVDTEVVDASMYASHSKQELVAALGKRLPENITQRAKTGFVVPLREWLKESNPQLAQLRGLRGWSLYVLERYCEEHRLSVPLDLSRLASRG